MDKEVDMSKTCMVYTGQGGSKRCRKSEMLLDKETSDLDSVLATIFEFAKYVLISNVQSCQYSNEADRKVCKDKIHLSIIEY